MWLGMDGCVCVGVVWVVWVGGGGVCAWCECVCVRACVQQWSRLVLGSPPVCVNFFTVTRSLSLSLFLSPSLSLSLFLSPGKVRYHLRQHPGL